MEKKTLTEKKICSLHPNRRETADAPRRIPERNWRKRKMESQKDEKEQLNKAKNRGSTKYCHNKDMGREWKGLSYKKMPRRRGKVVVPRENNGTGK